LGVGGRRDSGGRKSKGTGRSTEQAVVIDLDNLARYRYLSFAWFVRMAVAWLVGRDLFEDTLDLGSINNILTKAIEETKALKLNKEKRNKIINNLQDSKPINLHVREHFMDWEVKEHTRMFGGRGKEVRKFFKARPYVFGLHLLGRELTRIHGDVYLFIEPHIYLIELSLSLNNYREFYNSIRDLVREYERRRANKEEKNISETAFLTTLAGLIINNLRRYGVRTCMIRELVGNPCKKSQTNTGKERGENEEEGISGNAFVLYRVDNDKGITPLDLTNLVRRILELERMGLSVSRTLAGLADRFVNSRRGGVIDLINTVGDAMFKYTITGDLGYIYNMIRTVTTSEDYAEVRDSLLGVGGDSEEGDSEGLGTV
jgi:hypothetical protein